MTDFVAADVIRSAFSAAMSAMYRDEVPAYGALMSLVAKVNEATLAANPAPKARLEATDSLDRISQERHGAIRLGTPEELAMMRRAFAVMGQGPRASRRAAQRCAHQGSPRRRRLDRRSL